MLKIGITGGIGSGKSVVSSLLQVLGIPVYIADIESKKLTNSSPIIRSKLTAIFGENLYQDNILNKSLLASYIFSDKEKLSRVNSIIHPALEKHFETWLQDHENYSIVAKEAAIMFESGMDKLMDKIIMVYAPLEIRIDRAMLRDSVCKEKIIERMNNQMDDEKKKELSDFVIHNDGSASVITQALNILKKLGYTF